MKIVLVGFMGSGKSSVAKTLAAQLNVPAIETDELALEKSDRQEIKEIFEKDSELHFRELELQVGKNLSDKLDCVISTGGGMIQNKIIIDYLRKNGVVVYLETSFEEIEKRLGTDKSRPLFQDKNVARALYALRTPLYNQYADKTIKTDSKSVNEVVQNIIESVKQ